MSWIACVASVSVRFRSKQRGTRVKHREKNDLSKKRGGGGEEKKDTLENKLNDPKPLFCRKKSLTFQRRSKKMFLHWRANLADQNKQQPLTIDIRLTYHTVLSVWNKPLIETRQHCSTSRANQALCSLANAGFQNRGVCLQAFPSFPSPSPHFHFLALVSFLARPKPRIPFLGLSLLRNQTETLATQAMSWNLSQISRVIISRGAYQSWLIPYASQSNLECKKRVSRQHTTFTVWKKCCLLQWIFSLTGRLCSGGVYILTAQTMWFLPPVSYWEVATRILIFCGYCFWSAWLMICPLMQEHFLWPLVKCKVLHCG